MNALRRRWRGGDVWTAVTCGRWKCDGGSGARSIGKCGTHLNLKLRRGLSLILNLKLRRGLSLILSVELRLREGGEHLAYWLGRCRGELAYGLGSRCRRLAYGLGRC